MKNKSTASNKKQPVTLKDLKTKKNPKGGAVSDTVKAGGSVPISGFNGQQTVVGGTGGLTKCK